MIVIGKISFLSMNSAGAGDFREEGVRRGRSTLIRAAGRTHVPCAAGTYAPSGRHQLADLNLKSRQPDRTITNIRLLRRKRQVSLIFPVFPLFSGEISSENEANSLQKQG